MANNNNNKNNTDQIPPRVLVRRASKEAVFPSGFILTSAKTMTVPNGRDAIYLDRTQVPTDLMFTVPEGVYFKIAHLPEISQKGILVVGKVVGHWTKALLMVEMHNLTKSDIEIKAGEQIARLENLRGMAPELVDVSTLLESANNPTLGTLYNSKM